MLDVDFYQKVEGLVQKYSPETVDTIKFIKTHEPEDLIENPHVLLPLIEPFKLDKNYLDNFGKIYKKNKTIFKSVKTELENPYPGHDYWHAFMSGLLAGAFYKDHQELAVLGGLLHDIGRKEAGENNSHELIGARMAPRFLKDFDGAKRIVIDSVKCHKAGSPCPSKYEGNTVVGVVYDADKFFNAGIDLWVRNSWIIAKAKKLEPYRTIEIINTQIDWAKKVAESFRTSVGKKCGPVVVYRGIEIAEQILENL